VSACRPVPRAPPASETGMAWNTSEAAP
jgi:hypothetical protein